MVSNSLQSGASSLAKHRGAYFSAVWSRKETRVACAVWTGSPTHKGSGNLTTCSAASLLASSHLNVVILTYYGSSRRIENKFIFTTYGSWKEEEHLRVSTGRRYVAKILLSWQKTDGFGGKIISWQKFILEKNYIGKNLSWKKLYWQKFIREKISGQKNQKDLWGCPPVAGMWGHYSVMLPFDFITPCCITTNICPYHSHPTIAVFLKIGQLYLFSATGCISHRLTSIFV